MDGYDFYGYQMLEPIFSRLHAIVNCILWNIRFGFACKMFEFNSIDGFSSDFFHTEGQSPVVPQPNLEYLAWYRFRGTEQFKLMVSRNPKLKTVKADHHLIQTEICQKLSNVEKLSLTQLEQSYNRIKFRCLCTFGNA